MFVSRLPALRIKKFPFKSGVPGYHFFQNFIRRNPEISRCLQANLERARTDTMSPRIIALHFNLLNKTYGEYSIGYEALVFNLDETGLLTFTASRGCAKVLMRKEGRSTTLELQW